MKLIFGTFLLIALATGVDLAQTGKVDLAKKIRDATPAALPQTPTVAKARSDAQDDNLKGKVKRIIEESTPPGSLKRERSVETIYNESGNLLEDVSYLDGYPEEVTVWGYIDGKRVSKTGSVVYAKGERPPSDDMTLTIDEEQEPSDPNAPRDVRYGLVHRYKYDAQGRLIERWRFQNNGEVFNHTEYVYNGSQREVSLFGDDGARWSSRVELLDNTGNVTGSYSVADGKKTNIIDYSYQFDARGNWIVQKAFEKKTVRGKTVLKALWTSYRTITYYD